MYPNDKSHKGLPLCIKLTAVTGHDTRRHVSQSITIHQLAKVYHTAHWDDPLVSHPKYLLMPVLLVYGKTLVKQFSVKHLMQWISGSMVGEHLYLSGHRYNA